MKRLSRFNNLKRVGVVVFALLFILPIHLFSQALTDLGNNNSNENSTQVPIGTNPSDSLAALDSNLIVDRPHVIKREYDHKEQVIVGSIFMVSIIALLAIMNNFNPRHEQ